MINLNKRLACVASKVNNDDIVIDVGCDHAFLSIFLKQKGIDVLASDVKDGPVQIAISNIKKYNVSINVMCMDGIENIPDYIDTVVISGMGSLTMKKILVKEKLGNIKKIILSPNNDFDVIRRHLVDLDYIIIDEEMVFEHGKFYPVITFIKGKKKYNELEYKYGPCFINGNDNNFINYLMFILEQNNRIISMCNDNDVLYNLNKNNDEILNIIKKRNSQD